MLGLQLKTPGGGWSGYFQLKHANYAAVGLLAVVILFIIPNGKGGKLLDWEKAVTIPWGILLLFSGGIALAKAFISTGISQEVGKSLSLLTSLHPLLLVFLLCLTVSFLTEITSNTATTTLLMPILAAVATEAKMEPSLLMVPAAMSTCCAFMLPVATAPNAVIFSSKQITVKKMARTGFVLNLIGAVVITVIMGLLNRAHV